ncbi:MAG: hypothetical protein HYZ39_07830 [Mycolicibacterium cosmeticum]|nr:hypothetical protein [Mycolicibacterium cosmeticum]
MTDPSRGMRARRVSRRPGWILLSVLLVLAIVASSVLVFTNRVELLKLAVVLALWAAVVAAFVSVIYRRQSDVDQAKVRDLKLVYDLQLDREISARREYELAVESQLRRELAAELRAQAADEVAALRAELAALRNNLEILFDTDLDQRPALETDRPAGRVIASRIDVEQRRETDPRTEESPIIDVPVEPPVPEYQWGQSQPVGGAHRRAGEAEQPAPARESVWQPPIQPAPVPPPPPPPSQPQPAWSPPPPPPQAPRQPTADWQPVPAEGVFIPAGAPGSNWVAPPVQPAPTPPPVTPPPAAPVHPGPAMTPPPVQTRRGRHSGTDPEVPPWAARQPAPADPAPAPTLATSPPPPAPPEPRRSARHRSADDPQPPEQEAPEEPVGQHAGGQPVSELLSRLQTGSSEGGRRRRREE